MKRVLLVKIIPVDEVTIGEQAVIPEGEWGGINLVHHFDRVAEVRAYLRREAPDGEYAILHVFEQDIEVVTATEPVRLVSDGHKSKRAKAAK